MKKTIVRRAVNEVVIDPYLDRREPKLSTTIRRVYINHKGRKLIVHRMIWPEFRDLCQSRNVPGSGVVGFCNLFTGERQPVCAACLRIVIWTRELDEATPVPFDCTCRGVVPEGIYPTARYFPACTEGINYEDLARDGGIKWIKLDWEVLVLSPLRRFLAENDMCAALPCVAMLRYYCATGRVVSPALIELLFLRGFGKGLKEIFHCLDFGVAKAACFNSAVKSPVSVREVSRVTADLCLETLFKKLEKIV